MAASILGLAGNYFFGPIGGAIGSAIGQLLFAEDQVNEGPRLQDRNITSTGYGQDLPIIYGSFKVAGHIIEPQNFALVETRHEEDVGGKGGPSATNVTYTYDATFAVALCEGPIIGVRKIWLDAKLVYDFSSSGTAETIIASNRAASGITIYTGSSTQNADSVLEGINGSGNTPAYRGTAYIVFEKLQLAEFGNRVPNVTAEVIGSGSTDFLGELAVRTFGSPQSPYDFINRVLSSEKGWDFIGYNNGIFYLWDGQFSGRILHVTLDGLVIDEEVAPANISALFSATYQFPYDYWSSPTFTFAPLGVMAGVHYYYDTTEFFSLPNPAGGFEIRGYTLDQGSTLTQVNSIGPLLNQDRRVLCVALSPDGKRMLIVQGDAGAASCDNCSSAIYHMLDENADIIETGTVSGSGLGFRNFGKGHSGHEGADLQVSGGQNCTSRAYNNPVILENNYEYLWVHSASGVSIWSIKNGVMSAEGSLTITAAFSTGTLSPFRTHNKTIYAEDGVMLTAGVAVSSNVDQISVYSRAEVIDATSVDVKDIVDDVMDKCGVEAASRDNTGITSTTKGYAITRRMTGRRAIEPLERAYFFDTIETGYQLKGIERGGSSVATIDISEMDAKDYGTAPRYPLTKTRQQEVEIPREVTIQYANENRDYNTAAQRSQRIETLSEQSQDIILPINLTDNEAKQIVEKIHYNLWTERNSYSFTLMPEFLYLDPGDVITVTDGSENRLMRITRMTLTPGGPIQCEAVEDRPAIYSSDSTGVDQDGGAIVVGIPGPTETVFGDWPMFRNQDNDERLYLAGSKLFEGWQGAVVYRSVDSGVSYQPISTITDTATIGRTTDALATGQKNVIDRASSVNIQIKGSNTLTSIAESALLNYGNICMIGSECLCFQTATLEADGSYTLTNLLRGIRGTDHAMSGHAADEDFVLINNNLVRFDTTLNTSRKYKTVTFNNFLGDTPAEDFTYTGINLKPFSPVNIKGQRDSSDNLDITWIRRSRFQTSPLWSPKVGEDSESYEIDIYDAGFTSVLRTVTGLSSPSYTYTAALQVTDFGSAQASINMKIYQVSGTVGRGYEGSATL